MLANANDSVAPTNEEVANGNDGFATFVKTDVMMGQHDCTNSYVQFENKVFDTL